MKTVLTTNHEAIERELAKVETRVKQFQPLLDAMIKHDFKPSTNEFQAIVRGRTVKYENPLDEFLRAKTVSRHPSIDNLPITYFMKKTMIELPKECEEILNLYKALPVQKDVLSTVGKMEIVEDKLVISEAAKQAILDGNTIYAEAQTKEKFIRATEVLEMAKKLQLDTGINIFTNGLVQNAIHGNLATAEINPYVIIMKP